MGVVVLMAVVEVVYLGVVEVDCSGVVCFMMEGDIFVLAGVFVVMVVEVELFVRCVVNLVLWCLNEKGDL